MPSSNAVLSYRKQHESVVLPGFSVANLRTLLRAVMPLPQLSIEQTIALVVNHLDNRTRSSNPATQSAEPANVTLGISRKRSSCVSSRLGQPKGNTGRPRHGPSSWDYSTLDSQVDLAHAL